MSENELKPSEETSVEFTSTVTLNERFSTEVLQEQKIRVISSTEEMCVLYFNKTEYVVKTNMNSLTRTSFLIPMNFQLMILVLTMGFIVLTIITLGDLFNFDISFNMSFIFGGLLIAIGLTALAFTQPKITVSEMSLFLIAISEDGKKIWKAI